MATQSLAGAVDTEWPPFAAQVVIVGGGLAGCEAAFQLAQSGITVQIREQKPLRRSEAHKSDQLAELVCSNSLRGAALSNAVGLLKEELRRAGSLIMDCADRSAVPAGGALAVDRERFAGLVSERIRSHRRINVVARDVNRIPDERPCILATGPLTGEALAADIEALVGQDRIAYYDAIAPIVSTDSVDLTRVFAQSRYGKGLGDEYLNCPLDEPQYQAFVQSLVAADKVPHRSFEEPRFFEGCLPIDVMAARGPSTLRYGPMKPVGLVDPRTGRWPFAVVQLRAEDLAKSAYNLVGFQTRLTYGEQARLLRTIPGLENADFLRFGSVHRNTFVDSPRLLDDDLELKAAPGVWVAGQLSGVEGYVECAASGFLVGLFVACHCRGSRVPLPPTTTALGGLFTHLRRAVSDFQPSNVVWSLLPPLDGSNTTRLRKRDRYDALSRRALTDLGDWLREVKQESGGAAADEL